jgi:hypothetical protein
MPPRTTRKSYRLRASDRTMVGTLQPNCLSHQKPKASSRQQHESAKKENPKSLPTLRGLESRAQICAPSGRRRSFSLDSPLYRTPLPYKWVPMPNYRLWFGLSTTEDAISVVLISAPETQRGEVVEVSDEATEQTVRASGTVNAEILKAAVAFKNASGWKA